MEKMTCKEYVEAVFSNFDYESKENCPDKFSVRWVELDDTQDVMRDGNRMIECGHHTVSITDPENIYENYKVKDPVKDCGGGSWGRNPDCQCEACIQMINESTD